MSTRPIARERTHTLRFLESVRAFSPVFLDTEVDMTRVLAHRASAARHHSVITYVLVVAARVLAEHPEANAAVTGSRRPKVATYPGVDAKVALDKRIGGRRVVLSAIVPNPHLAGLDRVQDLVERYRDGDPGTLPAFAGARLLHRLPWPVGGPLFRLALRSLAHRPALVGTFAVTSLGHRPVDGFHSVGGTTVTLGLGRIADRPVARDGEVVIAPVLRLNLAFDHRVIDGAEAADVLTEVRAGLEGFTG
ncbi:2-oxo acid dehydrogenase subunit E2 [Actinosynnema sp. NPDC020468]|uniref:2-oxo acid dehydrogenase subunit E2 n=1 Tax=Actinosynnema sp. NPDC020468 TaxID=3154488 RepID=UPI00340260A5